MSLTTGRGPLSGDRAGRFTPPMPDGVIYVEPHPRRIRARLGERTVIDTEAALLVHRAGSPPTYAFPRDAVGDLPHQPEPAAPGYVAVSWDAVDEWEEEGRVLVHYPPNPYHRVDYRPGRRRLRVVVAGTVLMDADETTVCFETALAPRLYVRPDLVRTDLLRRSATTSYCNYKGRATYWDAVVDGTVVSDVAWSYEEPLPESRPIAGHLSFDPDRADVTAELPGQG